jgi:hypothetical protein
LTAAVPWQVGSGDEWLSWQTRHSPDLSAIIQEIVNQPGWVSGNDLVIVVQPSGSGTTHRRVFAWDRMDNALQTARLQVWYTMIYVSSTTNGTAGGVSFADEDILSFDAGSGTWAMVFDGSDVGVTGDVNAFAFLGDGSLLLSLDAAATVTGLGTVDDSDIIRFIPTSLGDTTSGTFAWYFDGSDVGLTTNDEDVDALDVLGDGRILLSTIGNFSVTGASGVDEDLFVFTPTALGSTTSGSWALYFDGSDVGLSTASSEDVNGTWQASNGDVYLTTLGAFSVTGASGDGADIFKCVPGSLGTTTSCTFSLYWDGSANGFAGEVMDGFFIHQ